MIKNTFILCLKESTLAEIRKSHFHLCHFFKPSNHSKAALLTFESSAAQIKLSQIAIISHQGFPTEEKKPTQKTNQHNVTYQKSKAGTECFLGKKKLQKTKAEHLPRTGESETELCLCNSPMYRREVCLSRIAFTIPRLQSSGR